MPSRVIPLSQFNVWATLLSFNYSAYLPVRRGNRAGAFPRRLRTARAVTPGASSPQPLCEVGSTAEIRVTPGQSQLREQRDTIGRQIDPLSLILCCRPHVRNAIAEVFGNRAVATYVL